jgi:hypothetical protein
LLLWLLSMMVHELLQQAPRIERVAELQCGLLEAMAVRDGWASQAAVESSNKVG